jgi:hypothetical protein
MNEQKFIHPHYQHVDGTSMAAPIVSGVVAQMLEANPSLTPAQIKEILMVTADPLNDAPAEGAGSDQCPAGCSCCVTCQRRAAAGHPHLINCSHEITFYYYDPSGGK